MRWPFFCTLLSILSCNIHQTDFHAKVIGVKDGDSIEVLDTNQKQLIIWLAHIDCPEYSQPYSKAAKKFTSDFCFGKNVVLDQTDVDRYGRLVCEVYVNDKSLNLALVENGLAWHHRRYSDDSKISEAEQKARESKIGLWNEPDPTPPWEWRAANRGNNTN